MGDIRNFFVRQRQRTHKHHIYDRRTWNGKSGARTLCKRWGGAVHANFESVDPEFFDDYLRWLESRDELCLNCSLEYVILLETT